MIETLMNSIITFTRCCKLTDLTSATEYQIVTPPPNMGLQTILEINRLEFTYQMEVPSDPGVKVDFVYNGLAIGFNPALFIDRAAPYYAGTIPAIQFYRIIFNTGVHSLGATWYGLVQMNSDVKLYNVRVYVQFTDIKTLTFRLDFINTFDLNGYMQADNFQNQKRYLQMSRYDVDVLGDDPNIYLSISPNAYDNVSLRSVGIVVSLKYLFAIPDGLGGWLLNHNDYYCTNAIDISIKWYHKDGGLDGLTFADAMFSGTWTDLMWLNYFLNDPTFLQIAGALGGDIFTLLPKLFKTFSAVGFSLNRDTTFQLKLTPQNALGSGFNSKIIWGIIRSSNNDNTITYLTNYDETRAEISTGVLPNTDIIANKIRGIAAPITVDSADAQFSSFVTFSKNYLAGTITQNVNTKYRVFAIYYEFTDPYADTSFPLVANTFITPEFGIKDANGIGEQLNYLSYINDYCGNYIGADVQGLVAGERLKCKYRVDFAGDLIANFAEAENNPAPFALWHPTHIFDILTNVEVEVYAETGLYRIVFDRQQITIMLSGAMHSTSSNLRIETDPATIYTPLGVNLGTYIDIVYDLQSTYETDVMAANVYEIATGNQIYGTGLSIDMSNLTVKVKYTLHFLFNKLTNDRVHNNFTRLLNEDFSLYQTLNFTECGKDFEGNAGTLVVSEKTATSYVHYDSEGCPCEVEIDLTSLDSELAINDTEPCAVLRCIKIKPNGGKYEHDNEAGSGEITEIQQAFIIANNIWTSIGGGNSQNTMFLDYCDWLQKTMDIRHIIKQLGVEASTPFNQFTLADYLGSGDYSIIADSNCSANPLYCTRYVITPLHMCPDAGDIDLRRFTQEYSLIAAGTFTGFALCYPVLQLNPCLAIGNVEYRMFDIYKEENVNGLLYMEHVGYIHRCRNNGDGTFTFDYITKIYDYIDTPSTKTMDIGKLNSIIDVNTVILPETIWIRPTAETTDYVAAATKSYFNVILYYYDAGSDCILEVP